MSLWDPIKKEFSLLLPPSKRKQGMSMLAAFISKTEKTGKRQKAFESVSNIVPSAERIYQNRLLGTSFLEARKHCLKWFLKGIFVRCGYLQTPKKSYHLEIVPPTPELEDCFIVVKKKLKLSFKDFPRKGKRVFYMKSRFEIRRFLKVVELFDKSLLLDDLIATRDMLSHVNRQVNFETANINKSVSASERLVDHIWQLFSLQDQEFWTDNLRELAQKRIEFPLDTIEKLGKRMSPPLSKSAVNHRLRRIESIFKKFFQPQEKSP